MRHNTGLEVVGEGEGKGFMMHQLYLFSLFAEKTYLLPTTTRDLLDRDERNPYAHLGTPRACAQQQQQQQQPVAVLQIWPEMLTITGTIPNS